MLTRKERAADTAKGIRFSFSHHFVGTLANGCSVYKVYIAGGTDQWLTIGRCIEISPSKPKHIQEGSYAADEPEGLDDGWP